jgi:hypothetical protein
MERLRKDLDGGAWIERHAHLREKPALDVGLRLAIAEPYPHLSEPL